jgi:ankyrin repeat protein
MGIASLSFDAGLEQYKRQAADLVKAYRSGDTEAMYCFRQLHPRLRGRAHTNDRNDVTDAEIRSAGVSSADAQCVVARWYGFADWPTLARFVEAVKQKGSSIWQFESAVEAIINGDVATLKQLLRDNPALVRARSTRDHHGMLLHYVSANGVEGYRQKTPKNAVKVAAILLKAGAEMDTDLDYGSLRGIYPERTGSTPLGMVATSVHPAVAGVQIGLLKMLLKYGASVDGLSGGWNPLIAALHNGRPEAAEFLAKRGARLDLEGAAGTGRLDVVKDFFRKNGRLKANATRAQMESGFIWACEYGRTGVVAFLLEKGMRINARPHGETGLHQAAYGGHAGIVKLLLERRARIDVKDKRYDNTPLGWALHGWLYPPPEAERRNHVKVVKLLVAAGAPVDRQWFENDAEGRRVTADRRMRAALLDGARLSGRTIPPLDNVPNRYLRSK